MIELARAIVTVPVGGTVTVVSDDEVARLDIPAWCAMRGHTYVGETPARSAPRTRSAEPPDRAGPTRLRRAHPSPSGV